MIRIAKDVNRPVELVNTIPMLGFFNEIVEIFIADPDHNKISVLNNIIFFLFRDLFFFL